MICYNCNTQLPDNAQICSCCGTTFYNNAQPQNFNGYGQAPQPVYNNPIPQPPKKNTGLIVGIIIAVVVLIAAIVALVLILKDDKKSDDKDNKEVVEATEDDYDDPITTTASPTTQAEPATTEAEPITTEAQIYDYDGTYVLDQCEMDGVRYSVEELEEMSGENFDMSLEVDGNICTLDAEAMGYDRASCEIQFDGNTVTLIEGDEVIVGTYDPDEHSISITSEGVDLIFVLDSYISSPSSTTSTNNSNSGTISLFEGDYDGTYTLDHCRMDGVEYSIEELEEMSGENFDMSLIVAGNSCTLDAVAMGYDKASCEIQFDGNTVTLIEGDEVMEGTYDASAQSITLTSSGVDMVFVKQ